MIVGGVVVEIFVVIVLVVDMEIWVFFLMKWIVGLVVIFVWLCFVLVLCYFVGDDV